MKICFNNFLNLINNLFSAKLMDMLIIFYLELILVISYCYLIIDYYNKTILFANFKKFYIKIAKIKINFFFNFIIFFKKLNNQVNYNDV